MLYHLARGVATVVYNNSQSATYAKEKLHGFEYPPGQRLIVKLDSNHDYPPCPPPGMIGSPGGPPYGGIPRAMAPHNGNLGSPPGGPGIGVTAPQMPGGPRPNLQQDLAQLAETIAQATSLIQAAGLTPGQSGGGHLNNMNSQGNNISTGETYDPSYCSVKLPPPQPLAPVDSAVAERLFIVCHPTPPPIYAMKDVFGRFGNLIDIYILNGKTFGYAKYASKESADKAIQVLHGQEVLGSRLKVMEADPHDKSDSGRKRLRIDDQS